MRVIQDQLINVITAAIRIWIVQSTAPAKQKIKLITCNVHPWKHLLPIGYKSFNAFFNIPKLGLFLFSAKILKAETSVKCIQAL